MGKFQLVEPEEKLSKEIKPYVTFPIINACMLKCLYCGDGGEMSISDKAQFDTEDLLDWHSEARKLGVEKFRITGGEPLLHKDFRTIVQTIAQDANTVLINTNGTALKKFRDKWIDSPSNCRYVVNYHGATEEVYNKVTGTSGHFLNLQEGVRMLADEGMLHRLNIVLCKHNIHEIYDVIDFCKEIGTDLKIQDVVSVPWQFKEWEELYLDTTRIEEEFLAKSTFVKDHKYARGFGTPSKIYTINGVNVTLKSVRNGSHYDMKKVCKGCEYYPCHEGVYDLFIFPNNTSFACNWTLKSKAPEGTKQMQLQWLIEVFQRSEYQEASNSITKMELQV
ncbi:radical SAM protein [Paenibacillus massiliensis]|uniref:radical SAM protein n=1 Tax=Paenibacillus massiliensis TaxID=225917 RepID=UPI00037CEFCE|nr:radical SAM protein [Paenibacillus massiliensis]